MKHAYVFPGQGSQFPGMGSEHYSNSAFAKRLFEQANDILGFRISDIMFSGSEEDLKQTDVTQPAVFLHSVIAFKSIDPSGAKPDMVAGHSLGELSALVANGTLSFEAGLNLVAIRAKAMQRARTDGQRLDAPQRDAGDDAADVQKLFHKRYRGCRYSFGYPACPELEDQVKLFELLQPERIGLSLTESFQLDPEQSTTALMVHHPAGKYFNI